MADKHIITVRIQPPIFQIVNDGISNYREQRQCIDLLRFLLCMPDTPGLAVWKSGHIGVYIGNGEVIEAMDTRYGVVKTKLQGRGWTHWLEVPGIKYD